MADNLSRRTEESVSILEEAWREYAACKGAPSEMFFDTSPAVQADARKICAGCRVRTECLEWALETEQQYGIFGGLTVRGRKQLQRRRKNTLKLTMRL